MATESSPLRVPAVLLTMVLVGYLLKVGAFLLQPLIIAFLLCMICRPLVATLERRKIPAGVTVFGLMIALIAVLAWVGGVVFENAKAFADEYYDQQATAAAGPAPTPDEGVTLADFERLIAENLEVDSLRDLDAEALLDQAKSLVPKLGGLLIGAVAVLGNVVSQVFLVLFFMIFIFAEQGVTRKKLLLAAGEQREEVDGIASRIAADVQLYLSVKTGISLLTAVLCWVGLWLIGVPYSAVFALLTFLLNFIPNVGSIFAALLPAALALKEPLGPGSAIGVLVLYMAVNVFLGNVVEPKVLGKQLNLSPLVILMALLFWGALWGPLGMFLAVPLTRSAQLVCANLPNLEWLAILMANEADESKIGAT